MAGLGATQIGTGDPVGMAGKAENMQGLCKPQNNAMIVGQKIKGLREAVCLYSHY
jgi:hypothetical protein